MPAEPSCIARAADELDSAQAIAVHLADGGTWESAFGEWAAVSGLLVNRFGIHTAATFRRRFGPWVTSYQEPADLTGAALALPGEEVG